MFIDDPVWWSEERTVTISNRNEKYPTRFSILAVSMMNRVLEPLRSSEMESVYHYYWVCTIITVHKYLNLCFVNYQAGICTLLILEYDNNSNLYATWHDTPQLNKAHLGQIFLQYDSLALCKDIILLCWKFINLSSSHHSKICDSLEFRLLTNRLFCPVHIFVLLSINTSWSINYCIFMYLLNSLHFLEML